MRPVAPHANGVLVLAFLAAALGLAPGSCNVEPTGACEVKSEGTDRVQSCLPARPNEDCTLVTEWSTSYTCYEGWSAEECAAYDPGAKGKAVLHEGRACGDLGYTVYDEKYGKYHANADASGRPSASSFADGAGACIAQLEDDAPNGYRFCYEASLSCAGIGDFLPGKTCSELDYRVTVPCRDLPAFHCFVRDACDEGPDVGACLYSTGISYDPSKQESYKDESCFEASYVEYATGTFTETRDCNYELGGRYYVGRRCPAFEYNTRCANGTFVKDGRVCPEDSGNFFQIVRAGCRGAALALLDDSSDSDDGAGGTGGSSSGSGGSSASGAGGSSGSGSGGSAGGGPCPSEFPNDLQLDSFCRAACLYSVAGDTEKAAQNCAIVEAARTNPSGPTCRYCRR